MKEPKKHSGKKRTRFKTGLIEFYAKDNKSVARLYNALLARTEELLGYPSKNWVDFRKNEETLKMYEALCDVVLHSVREDFYDTLQHDDVKDFLTVRSVKNFPGVNEYLLDEYERLRLQSIKKHAKGYVGMRGDDRVDRATRVKLTEAMFEQDIRHLEERMSDVVQRYLKHQIGIGSAKMEMGRLCATVSNRYQISPNYSKFCISVRKVLNSFLVFVEKREFGEDFLYRINPSVGKVAAVIAKGLGDEQAAYELRDWKPPKNYRDLVSVKRRLDGERRRRRLALAARRRSVRDSNTLFEKQRLEKLVKRYAKAEANFLQAGDKVQAVREKLKKERAEEALVAYHIRADARATSNVKGQNE